VFVPGSRLDDVDGCVVVEAAGPPGLLRTVQFARGETEEGLDVAAPVVVEGELRVVRHPPRGLPIIVRQGSPVKVQEKT
jgi:hypothetical protein